METFTYRGTTYVECPLNVDDLDGRDDLKEVGTMLLGDTPEAA